MTPPAPWRARPGSLRVLAPALAALATLVAAPAVLAPQARAQSAEAPATATAGLDLEDARTLEDTLRGLARSATPKTVMVQGVIGLGTGAVIDAAGTVVTNAHVAAGARYAILLHPDGRRVLARRRGIDYARDLAVLDPVERPEHPVPHFEVLTERPAPGTWVAALGYPGGPRGDAMPTFTAGRVLDGEGGPQVNGFLDYSDAIRIDAPIFSGNSGGPLIDMQGRLIGINGAVSLAGAFHGLAIPAEVVMERTAGLEGGIVRLPGGAVLDPADSALLSYIDERLDAVILELMQAQLEGPGIGGLRGPAARSRIPAAEEIARRARAIEHFLDGARNRDALLLPAFAEALGERSPRAIAVIDESGREGYATTIAGLGTVACASSFAADARTLTTAAGRAFEVLAWSERDDLLLLGPKGGEGAPGEGAAAPAVIAASRTVRPVGTFLAVAGPEGLEAAGVLSAGARDIPANALALASGDSRSLPERIIAEVTEWAETLGQDEIADLGRELMKAFELRNGFSLGSPPRPYARVISLDAPIGPRHAGAPVVDLDGRALGIVVGTAHFGTSYAVPIDAIELAFGPGGDAVRGAAALQRGVRPAPAGARARPQAQESRPDLEGF